MFKEQGGDKVVLPTPKLQDNGITNPRDLPMVVALGWLVLLALTMLVPIAKTSTVAEFLQTRGLLASAVLVVPVYPANLLSYDVKQALVLINPGRDKGPAAQDMPAEVATQDAPITRPVPYARVLWTRRAAEGKH